MNVEIGTESAQFPENYYIIGIFVAVRDGSWMLFMVVLFKDTCTLVTHSVFFFYIWVKGTRFFASGSFHESVSPQPQSIPLRPFRIFWKFAEIFAAQGLPPMVHLDLRISPRIFEKIRNDPNVIIRGLGEGDSWKKTFSKKSRDTVPLR